MAVLSRCGADFYPERWDWGTRSSILSLFKKSNDEESKSFLYLVKFQSWLLFVILFSKNMNLPSNINFYRLIIKLLERYSYLVKIGIRKIKTMSPLNSLFHSGKQVLKGNPNNTVLITWLLNFRDVQPRSYFRHNPCATRTQRPFLVFLAFSLSKNFKFARCLGGFHRKIVLDLLKHALFFIRPL